MLFMTSGYKNDSLKDYPSRVKPYEHQEDALVSSLEETAWAYFMEMGTGKSKIIIDNACYLYLNRKIDTLVVFAKKGEYATWIYHHLPNHCPEEVNTEAVLFSAYKTRTSKGKKELNSLVQVDTSRLRVLVINIEAIATAPGEKILSHIYKTSTLGVFIVVDEATCIKHHKSKRSKAAREWGMRSKYRRIMTGTPMTQSPLDLWGQCLFLGQGLLKARSYYAFRGQYANLEDIWVHVKGARRTVKKVCGYKHLDRLTNVISEFSTIVSKDECLDLPEKVYSKCYVPLTSEQQKLYDEMRDFAMASFQDKPIELEATNVLDQMLKLHQISCGQLKTGDRDYESIPNNRVSTLLELLEDYQGKVIIWATYRQTIIDVVQALQETYGVEAVAPYFGGVSDKSRVEAVERFQDMDDPLRFFVANPQSGGYGLTLTAAHLVIYYSNSYNLEHRLQSEDRAHRIGQGHKVNYIDLVSSGTIDEKIINILREKKSLMDEVLRSGRIDDWI